MSEIGGVQVGGNVLLASRIASAGEHAYTVMSLFGQIVSRQQHARANCDLWAYAAHTTVVDELSRNEGQISPAEVEIVEWEPTTLDKIRFGVHYHRYLRILTGDNSFIVDGTWQQFLKRKKRTLELPKVMVCDVSNAAVSLGELGIKERAQIIWVNDGSRLNVVRSTVI